MDILPAKLHERVSVILGSKNEVLHAAELHGAAHLPV
jgi:fructose-1,6-bisphosphatase